MSKNIILGVVAFGGLALLTQLTFSDPETSQPEALSENPPEVILSIASQFPVYPQSELVHTRESSGEASQDVSLSLQTQTPVPDVYQWYEDALSSNGWNIKSDKNVAGYRIMQAEKDNLFTSLQVTNAPEAGMVAISQQTKVRQ